jgi:diguanylate cyclase (GGDEF)-like protein
MSARDPFSGSHRYPGGASCGAGAKAPDLVDIGSQVEEWREITTLVAELCKVKACLVLRIGAESLDVMAASQTDGNPYTKMQRLPRNSGLFSDEVIATQVMLEVPDARTDAVWKDGPTVRLGMVFYCGVPINYPDGAPFGVLCIVDDAPKTTTEIERKIINGFARVIQDHLKLEIMNQSLAYDATHDPMLGLLNRRAFFDRLEERLRAFERNGTPWALLSFDVDHFKQVNDTLGHAIGDQTLRAITEVVGRITRDADGFARIGGEEFAIIAEVGGMSGARTLAERVRAGVEACPELLALVGHPVTISCGVTLPFSGDTSDTIMARADGAMYAAKRQGRNTVSVAH